MKVTGMSRPMAADGTIRFSTAAARAQPVGDMTAVTVPDATPNSAANSNREINDRPLIPTSLRHGACCVVALWGSMQITVQPGVSGTVGWDDQIGCGPGIVGGPKSISGVWASGSVDGRPWMLRGNPGPSPSGFSRCRSASGGMGPVTGRRSTGTTPVAYAAAQPSTLRA